MLLCSFEVQSLLGSHERLGLMVAPGVILDANFAHALMLVESQGHPRPYKMADVLVPSDMMEYLVNGEFGYEALHDTLEYLGGMALEPDLEGADGEQIVFGIDEVTLVAPLTRPNHIRRRLDPETDVYAFCNADAVIGAEAEFPYFADGHVELHVALAAVIGTEANDVAEEDAAEYVAGYTVCTIAAGADEEQPVRDLVYAMGPVLATPDEFASDDEIAFTAAVGEDAWASGTTGIRTEAIVELVTRLSQEAVLQVGDVLVLEPFASDCSQAIGQPLQPGDIVTVEVDRIGRLRNHVADGE